MGKRSYGRRTDDPDVIWRFVDECASNVGLGLKEDRKARGRGGKKATGDVADVTGRPVDGGPPQKGFTPTKVRPNTWHPEKNASTVTNIFYFLALPFVIAL